MLQPEQIEDFNKRIELANQNPIEGILCFPEITLNKKQLKIIARPLFGFTKKQLLEYYKGKIDGEILLSTSSFTTKEDQPDFQYLIDLGIKALKKGMTL
jgi:hypothetical protein